MEPYYQDDLVTLYHGDCREVLLGLDRDSARAVITDPPYGVDKAEWDSAFPVEWMAAASLLAPVLGLMPGIDNLLRCPGQIGRWRYRWTLAAHLTNGMTRGRMGYGNWIPCLIYADESVSLHRQASDVGRIVVGRDEKPDHPSPKPYPVMTFLVDRLSSEGEAVIDPFAGSGTTLAAAKQINRPAVGIEIKESYCEQIAKRLAQDCLDFGAA